jgi:hypothetical protein
MKANPPAWWKPRKAKESLAQRAASDARVDTLQLAFKRLRGVDIDLVHKGRK